MLGYGYREHERPELPKYVDDHFVVYKAGKETHVELDDTFNLTRFRESDHRPVVAASLGMHVPGACLPHPDPGHTTTTLVGSAYRFGRKIETKSPEMRKKFAAFVKRKIPELLTPLDESCDTSVETWLKNCPYTQARKDELYSKFIKSGLGLDREIHERFLRVQSFMKDEHYEDWKHARGINSRTDEFKCLVGPIFQLISDRVFSLPYFIKKIPIKERPQYIIDLLFKVGRKYLITDYTSFEAHFTKDMMEDCEMQLYEYMSSKIPDGENWLNLIRRAKTGTNHINFKNFSIDLEAKRMSGEMDTSLSNGFSNLMFMLFLAEEAGCKTILGVIEGDDGLFVFDADAPTEKLFAEFGLSIKMIEVDELSHASFCGMVFDLKDRTIVTNPIEELVSFGWTRAQYARSSNGKHMCLLRAKALSLAYQYPGCPILSKLAYKVCQLTAGYDSLSFLEKQGRRMVDGYYYELLKKAHLYFDKNDLLREPGMNTRLLVEQLYGVTVSDQLSIEKYIDSLTQVGPLDSPDILKYVKQSWIDYYEGYCVKLNIKTDYDNINACWPRTCTPTNHESFRR